LIRGSVNDNVVAFACAHGMSPWDLGTQLLFIAYDWQQFPNTYGFPKLLSDTDIVTATQDFCSGYENSAGYMQQRVTDAIQVYDQFGGGNLPDENVQSQAC
jgi:hypothetical protein